MKKTGKWLGFTVLAGLLAAFLAFSGCGGGGDESTPNTPNTPGSPDIPKTVAVTGVSLETSISLVVDGTETLTATITPSNATNKRVTWSSSNTGVATVGNGIVTAVSTGTATITVTTVDGDKTASCEVTVSPVEILVESVSLETSISLVVGGTETLTATITPSNATNKSVTWSSSNEDVVTVSESGVITAKKVGTATITVKTVYGNHQATCTVTVNRINPIVDDFTVSGIGTYTYDGVAKAVTVKAKDGKTKGTITVKYNNGTAVPSNVGTYTVTFDVEADTNYNAASGLSAGTLIINPQMGNISENKIEYYWVDQHGSLVTTSGGTVTVAAGTTLTITAQSSGYVVKQWHLDGVNTGQSGNTYSFSSTTAGKHTIGLFVEKDGRIYNTNIIITVNRVTVSYNINGGTGTTPSAQTVDAGSSITLNNGSGLSRTGYTFGGWNIESSGTGTNYNSGSLYTPTSNITLYATWTSTITFNANTGTGTAPASQTIPVGTSIILPNGSGLTRSGYTFSGWNTNSSGTGTTYAADSFYTPTGNITLYARWIANITVTFNGNNGTGTVPSQTVPVGSIIMLPSGSELTRSGYTFSGWNTNSSGTGTNYKAGDIYIIPSSNITLYARWNSTVTFNINSGTGTTPTSQTAPAGSVITLPSGSGLTRSGYVFGGWNTNSSGTGTNYDVGTSYTVPTSNITLYAKWVIIVTVNFNVNGGTGTVPTSQTTPAGSVITLPSGSGLTRSGYVFSGWNTNSSGTGTNYNAGASYTIPTSNITLYAKWNYDGTNTIFSEDFEGTTHSFTIVNGTQTNYWYVGTATANGGTKSAYISNNSGTSNAYTITSTSVVHMYRDVTFSSSTSPYTLCFDWKTQGESNYDYLKVFLIETSVSPTAGSQPSSTALGTYVLGGTNWNSATISIPATNSGTTKRLVFTWVNDSSQGTQPPIAVDNIVLTK